MALLAYLETYVLKLTMYSIFIERRVNYVLQLTIYSIFIKKRVNYVLKLTIYSIFIERRVNFLLPRTFKSASHLLLVIVADTLNTMSEKRVIKTFNALIKRLTHTFVC